MEIFETLSQLGYGELHFGRDEASGLRAIVAIHSTRLGPAIGGSRIRAYATEADAIDDVTRLAQAMTYKAAVARLPHGGGKAVLIAPPGLNTPAFGADKRTALFRAFGRFVDGLAGRYVTTEDSGTGAADMDVIRTVTKHVLGASAEKGGSGDPSPLTALGVRRGIEAVAEHVLGKPALTGLHVAVQGVGHVGAYLARELKQAGARLTITDVDPARRAALAAELGATVVEPDAILETECDILAPCALGGALTESLVPRLRCRAVAGAANNQLRTAEAGRALYARGIFYAPDYAINAGGLINVAEEFAGYDKDRAREKTLAIYDTISDIIARSRRENTPPEVIADRIAQEVVASGRA
ncbi:MAG TPA: Glu/Leu/Phe/Val dehydrogenase dimerization domain-containing protein [Polyangia bacterium]